MLIDSLFQSKTLSFSYWQIVEEIAAQPGIIQDQLVAKMVGRLSRVPVIKRVHELEKMKIIRVEKLPLSTHRLYINQSSICVETMAWLRRFEDSYFPLVKAATDIYNQNSARTGRNTSFEYQLMMWTIFSAFSDIVNLVLYASRFYWPKEIPDPQLLRKLTGRAFEKIANMQSELVIIAKDAEGLFSIDEPDGPTMMISAIPLTTWELFKKHKLIRDLWVVSQLYYGMHKKWIHSGNGMLFSEQSNSS